MHPTHKVGERRWFSCGRGGPNEDRLRIVPYTGASCRGTFGFRPETVANRWSLAVPSRPQALELLGESLNEDQLPRSLFGGPEHDEPTTVGVNVVQ